MGRFTSALTLLACNALRRIAFACLQGIQAEMQRTLLATRLGAYTGYRTLEATVPLRGVTRSRAELDTLLATGAIRGGPFRCDALPSQGLPPRPRDWAAPVAEARTATATAGAPRPQTRAHLASLRRTCCCPRLCQESWLPGVLLAQE
jgi:hypothetical protein